MTETKKVGVPSLPYTVIANTMQGAIVGGLVGSGIEDLITNFQFAKNLSHVDDISLATAAIGGVSMAILGTLKYFNRDKYDGVLFIETVESIKPQEQKALIPEPNLEGIARTVENLTKGIKNQNVAQNLYNRIMHTIQKNPLERMKFSYEMNKDSFLASSFEVFAPFRYKGVEINPKQTLDKFFENGEKIYEVFIEKLSEKAESITSQNKTFSFGSTILEQKDKLFRDLVQEEITLAQDIALWATYLSKREGVVGSNVRAKLSEMGITNPNYLAYDVKVLGTNMLRLYDSLK